MEELQQMYDIAYLKLTVIVLLLLIIIYHIKSERFTPSASILANDIYNSTAGFDHRKN